MWDAVHLTAALLVGGHPEDLLAWHALTTAHALDRLADRCDGWLARAIGLQAVGWLVTLRDRVAQRADGALNLQIPTPAPGIGSDGVEAIRRALGDREAVAATATAVLADPDQYDPVARMLRGVVCDQVGDKHHLKFTEAALDVAARVGPRWRAPTLAAALARFPAPAEPTGSAQRIARALAGP